MVQHVVAHTAQYGASNGAQTAAADDDDVDFLLLGNVHQMLSGAVAVLVNKLRCDLCVKQQ